MEDCKSVHVCVTNTNSLTGLIVLYLLLGSNDITFN
jgi:hypothetical protein